jgi:phage baseplate assembly protein V
MSFEISEIYRALNNLIRIATISEIDYTNFRARVKFGTNETALLPWIESRAGENVTHSPPEIDEQVLIFCPSGDTANGIILRGIYSNAKKPASGGADIHNFVFKDGGKIEYNTANGKMIAEAKGEIEIKAATNVKITAQNANVTVIAAVKAEITAPLTEINGNLNIKGNVSSAGAGGGAGTINSTGNLNLNGNITVTGNISAGGTVTGGVDVIGGGKSLKNHIHNAPGGNTSTPL